MSLTEEVIAQAGFIAQDLESLDSKFVETVCRAAVASLEARLRDDLTAEDCQADFVTAAGMLAVAALTEIGDWTGVEQFTAGDLTVKRKKPESAVDYLRFQAELLMAPYLKTAFTFMGV